MPKLVSISVLLTVVVEIEYQRKLMTMTSNQKQLWLLMASSFQSKTSLFLYFTESKVTSDFIVDILGDFWKSEEGRFSEIKTLLINQDNGGENSQGRTQFMKRIVEFAQSYKLNIRLAYYPPYHSKYNPIERTWAALENHWNGSILDEVETGLNFAKTMTWNGKNPVVKLVSQTYFSGVRLTKKAMQEIENKIKRLTNFSEDNLPNLGKWFIDICCGVT